jgi:hypothetical protein
MWFGGMRVGPWILRRLVAGGHGFHPFGSPTPEELEDAPRGAARCGRDPAELEMVGGIRGRFPDATSVADLAEAADQMPAQVERGYGTICFKPSMFTDDPREVGRVCRELVARAEALA